MKELFCKAIDLCLIFHNGASRRWDEDTPYAVHPLWCAMTFLQETNLPNTVDRGKCALALFLHDGPEETGRSLPDWVPRDVVELVELMTFSAQPGSTEIERSVIWERPPLIRLLKLYDKTSNLLDGVWMTDEKRQQYITYIYELIADVEKNFGKNLNITKIARAIADESLNKLK